MIINIFSTPRTGGIYFTYYTARQNNSEFINELFNEHMFGTYRFFDKNNTLCISYDYHESFFYYDYYHDQDCYIKIKRNYSPWNRSLDEEREYRFNLLKNRNTNQNLVLNNHVGTMCETIQEYLTLIAEKNIYLYRKNILNQLYSFAIAKMYNNFISFNKDQIRTEKIKKSNKEEIIRLIGMIKKWQNLKKSQNSQLISYEELDFSLIHGFPIKQNSDYTLRLSSDEMKEIDDLYNFYYLNNY